MQAEGLHLVSQIWNADLGPGKKTLCPSVSGVYLACVVVHKRSTEASFLGKPQAAYVGSYPACE